MLLFLLLLLLLLGERLAAELTGMNSFVSVLRRLPCNAGMKANARFMTTNIDLKQHTSPASFRPLAQFYRNHWPDPVPQSNIPEVVPPKRTVPDECLHFSFKFSKERGAAIFYPHLTTNPADRKVTLQVSYTDFISREIIILLYLRWQLKI